MVPRTTDNSGVSAPTIPDYRATVESGVVTYDGLDADQWTAQAVADHVNGWHPIPIGRVDPHRPDKHPHKRPWCSGLHGYEGTDLTAAEIEAMPTRIVARMARGERGLLNLGVRLPVGVIGIDVDHYGDKHGLDTLKHYEKLWGPLPPTHIVTAREYETGSGIRLYRVNAETWRWPGDLGTDVEILDRNHRLIAVPPSIHHTGSRYRIYGPNGNEITSGVLPPVTELEWLP